jgi:hypothetical protein
MIRQVLVPKWERTPDVSAKEAILFVLDYYGPRRPTDLWTILDYDFIPSFDKDNLQLVLHNMLVDETVILTTDRYVKRK